MLYTEIIAVCSEIHTKHINTLWGQNAEVVNVKPGGTYSDHWALSGSNESYRIAQISVQSLIFTCLYSHTCDRQTDQRPLQSIYSTTNSFA